MDNTTITHDPALRRFSTTVNGHTAVLDYRPVNETIVEYLRTFVPTEIRKRGVARRLTTYALEHAARNDLKVIPTCWFVAKVMRENPEFANLAAD